MPQGGQALRDRPGALNLRTVEAADSAASWMPLAMTAAAMLTVLAAILLLDDGSMSYTLDDAYIHLTLAENIARFRYGTSLEESAAAAVEPPRPGPRLRRPRPSGADACGSDR